jgi:hypothetical protein
MPVKRGNPPAQTSPSDLAIPKLTVSWMLVAPGLPSPVWSLGWRSLALPYFPKQPRLQVASPRITPERFRKAPVVAYRYRGANMRHFLCELWLTDDGQDIAQMPTLHSPAWRVHSSDQAHRSPWHETTARKSELGPDSPARPRSSDGVRDAG